MRLMRRDPSPLPPSTAPRCRLPGFDSSDLADTMAPMVSMLTLIRNRDCLMCYLRHRMERIENMRWDVGDMPEVCSGRVLPFTFYLARTHAS